MKMARKDLKVLIKECLVEILAEGLGEDLNEATARRPRRKATATQPKYRSMLNPSEGSSGGMSDRAQGGIPTSALKNAILESAQGNSVMQDIFADTAMTSLPTLLESAGPQSPAPRAGSVEHLVANSSPEEVFGEDADRWASLAFGEKSSGPSSAFAAPPPAPVLRKLSASELDAPVGNTKKTA